MERSHYYLPVVGRGTNRRIQRLRLQERINSLEFLSKPSPVKKHLYPSRGQFDPPNRFYSPAKVAWQGKDEESKEGIVHGRAQKGGVGLTHPLEDRRNRHDRSHHDISPRDDRKIDIAVMENVWIV